ncbi:hypothetical protein RHAB15C_0001001 [Candidatus Rhabdochlamydia porcellionis]|jgi:hypothetical protein|uniref:Mobile element protein n=1 Tax=Candidatus Rhabdochlamydia porcellionis TaxID=225148 RepID=A0ABX8Z0C3_9BACT|nr:hypothetical protein RHAB15C_0001001 [Candidatus Rhabdochlamydia porcellionis]
MRQILHGCAKTTKAIRRKIQNSQKSIAKTVLKWRKRGFQHDAPMGPKKIHSTILSNRPLSKLENKKTLV